MTERVPDYVRQAERRVSRERGEFVGFLACSHGRGRLLKVALPDERRIIRARCPVEGCPHGEHETAAAMTRPRHRGEVCDLSIDGAAVDPPAAEPEPVEEDAESKRDPGASRRRLSDADILAAVPTEKAPAYEVAKALGYGATTGFVRRLERINERATAAGESAPVILARAGTGHPVQVRRVGEAP